jgi:TRAP-type uncharacterized transport system substrate-binding protein
VFKKSFQNIDTRTLHIKKVKDLRGGGVLVGCSSSEDHVRLKNIATEKRVENYVVSEVLDSIRELKLWV